MRVAVLIRVSDKETRDKPYEATPTFCIKLNNHFTRPLPTLINNHVARTVQAVFSITRVLNSLSMLEKEEAPYIRTSPCTNQIEDALY